MDFDLELEGELVQKGSLVGIPRLGYFVPPAPPPDLYWISSAIDISTYYYNIPSITITTSTSTTSNYATYSS
jgi:hypothetical protein